MPRNAHCSFCGHAFVADASWPRTCAGCQNTSYTNPLPVAVALVPVGEGLLAVRRGIEPRKGQLALPGGFIEVGESWQQAAAREVFEETQIQVDASGIQDFCVLSAPDGTVLIFGLAQPISPQALDAFTPNTETMELALITSLDEPLAFPLHTEAARRFLERHTPAQAQTLNMM